MPPSREIYLLDPKRLSPETIAVTFAKTSRSPQTFREIAAELTDETSADFHEKWVVGYGHSSVAEHAVLHIAVENISRLAVECLESNRLAAYTEKSSRYQIWDEDHFYIPSELCGHPLKKDFLDINFRLLRHYQQAVNEITDYLRKEMPRQENETERAFEQRVRTCSADVCRYYLPASALANVGLTINARALEHALVKMLSHNLEEVRAIGREIKKVAQTHVPTLVKYADENEYIRLLDLQFSQEVLWGNNPAYPAESWFNCIASTPDGEIKILAALLCHYGHQSFDGCLASINAMTAEEKQRMTAYLLGTLSEHDIPARELEYANMDVEVVLDQGAYYELKRHRMMSQLPQRLSTRLGFAVPALFTLAGISDQFVEDMEIVRQTYDQFSEFNPEVAAYIVPNAFNRRVLLEINLRSALHLVQLRSAPNAHFAMRRFALRLAEELRGRFPLFAPYILPNPKETWRSISENYFSQLY